MSTMTCTRAGEAHGCAECTRNPANQARPGSPVTPTLRGERCPLFVGVIRPLSPKPAPEVA